MDSRSFHQKERERIRRYQHQQRGLRFHPVWLPPTTDRSVNVVGRNGHVFRGQVPAVPLDQLPPEVDSTSIDEQQLYEEIRDMSFPVVPQREPLGPARRIGGEHTRAKRLSFAPVAIQQDPTADNPILGADGKVYRGTVKPALSTELDRKVRGTKRSVKSRAAQGSIREYVMPPVVGLYVDGETVAEGGQSPVPLIQVPASHLNRMLEAVRIQEEKESKKKHVRAGDTSSKGSVEHLNNKSSTVSKNLEAASGSQDSETASGSQDSETVSSSQDSEKVTGLQDSENATGSDNSKGIDNVEEAPREQDSQEIPSLKGSKDISDSQDLESFSGPQVPDDDSNMQKSKEVSGVLKDSKEYSKESLSSKDSQPTNETTEHAEVDALDNEPTIANNKDQENSDKPDHADSKSDQTVAKSDKTSEKSDQTDDKSDQTGAESHQTGENYDQTDAESDQTGAESDQTGAKSDQTGAKSDQTDAESDKTDKSEQIGEKSDLTDAKLHQTGENSDLTDAESDQNGTMSDQTVATNDQTGAKSDQTGEKSDQTGVNFDDANTEEEEKKGFEAKTPA